MGRATAAVTLRVHQRAELLDKVLAYWTTLKAPDVDIVLSILEDRPTPEVRAVVDKYPVAQRLSCPFPILSFELGEKWRESCDIQYQALAEMKPRPDWVIFADDDRWFEQGWEVELAKAVKDKKTDLFYATSLFFWTPTEVRTDFFEHNSVAMYRYRPGDHWDLERHLQAPQQIHDAAHKAGRVKQFKHRLLDFGYASDEERRRLLHTFKLVGRIDGVTRHLLDPEPKLEKYAKKQSHKR